MRNRLHHNCPLIMRTAQTHAAESLRDFTFNVIFALAVCFENFQAFVMKIFCALCDVNRAKIINIVELFIFIQREAMEENYAKSPIRGNEMNNAITGNNRNHL